jgi:hypothetical protein
MLPEFAPVVLAFLQFLFIGGDAGAMIVETFFEIGDAAVVRLQKQSADDVNAVTSSTTMKLWPASRSKKKREASS